MKHKISLKESELRGIVKECITKALSETVLGNGDRFTPFSEKDREENFAPYNGKVSTNMFKRNSSYKTALMAAKERMAKKKSGQTPESDF